MSYSVIDGLVVYIRMKLRRRGGSLDWIGCGSEHAYKHRGSDWTGSVSLWIRLDWIWQNGPMSNSGSYTTFQKKSASPQTRTECKHTL